MTCATKNTIAMVLFHLCTVCGVQNVDNAIAFKLSSDDKFREVYAATTSAMSAGDTVTSTTRHRATAIHHIQAFAGISRSGYVVIATKPVHRLQILPTVHN